MPVGRDHNLVRHHQHQPVLGQVGEPFGQQGKRCLAVDMAVKKGIQPVKGREVTHVHFGGGFDTAAPAAAEDRVKPDAIAPQIGTKPARLPAAGFVKIALGGAVIDVKVRRIAETRAGAWRRNNTLASIESMARTAPAAVAGTAISGSRSKTTSAR